MNLAVRNCGSIAYEIPGNRFGSLVELHKVSKVLPVTDLVNVNNKDHFIGCIP